MDKRSVLMVIQVIQSALAALLAILTATGVIAVWMVMAVVLVAGAFQALEQPVRNSFVYEVVGPGLTTNAIGLHHVVFNVSRAIGPAIAAVVAGTVGLAWTFGINALSYLVVTLLLLAVRVADLDVATPIGRTPGQVREAVRYVVHDRDLFLPFLLAAAVGMVGWGWEVMAPLLALDTFAGNEDTIAMMFGTLGVGSIVCGLLVAGYARASVLLLGIMVALLGVMRIAVGTAPSMFFVLLPLFLAGGTGTAVRTISQSIMQTRADPAIRGRTMAMLGLGLTGMTPVGAALMGWISETADPRIAMHVSGMILLAACVLTVFISRTWRPRDPEDAGAPVVDAGSSRPDSVP